jgi:hypothetical protein
LHARNLHRAISKDAPKGCKNAQKFFRNMNSEDREISLNTC